MTLALHPRPPRQGLFSFVPPTFAADRSCVPPPSCPERNRRVRAACVAPGFSPASTTPQSPLCFHILTKPFSRNPFPLTFIQNAGGCHPLAEQLSKPKHEPRPANSRPTNNFSLKPGARLLVRVPPASCRPLPPTPYSKSNARRLQVSRIPIARPAALRYSVGPLCTRELPSGPIADGNIDWIKLQ